MQAVFLTFETGHILHGDAEQQREQKKKKRKERSMGMGWKKEREGGRHVFSHNLQTEDYLYIVLLLLGSYMACVQSCHYEA